MKEENKIEFTLMGESFNVRTDHVDKVKRFGNSLKITYLDRTYEVWSANNSYQIPKIDLLEIVLRAVETGYNNGWNDHYRKLKKEGKILSPESLQKLLEYDELVEDPESTGYREIKI